MTIRNVDDLRTPIGDVLQLTGSDGILLQAQGQTPFALLPLDDELLDFLLARNPRFMVDCREIRQRMAKGACRTQAEVDSLFGRG